MFVLGEEPARGIHDSFGKPEKKFSTSFTKSKTTFCLRSHQNGDERYQYVSKTEMYKFKALDNTPLSQFCLGSVSKNFENDELKETALIGNVYDFSIEYRVIHATDILHIHDYLIKIHLIKLYLGR